MPFRPLDDREIVYQFSTPPFFNYGSRISMDSVVVDKKSNDVLHLIDDECLTQSKT